MKKERRNIIILFLVALLIIIIFFIYNKNSSNYDTFLCGGKDYGDLDRYSIDQSDVPFDERVYGPTTYAFNSKQCKEDCSAFCPTINMKYQDSNVVNVYDSKSKIYRCPSIKGNLYTNEPEYDTYSCSCKCI